jgi:hypothetical protein
MSPEPDHDAGAARNRLTSAGQPVSKYGRLGGFAHQLLICLAAITLGGVLTNAAPL